MSSDAYPTTAYHSPLGYVQARLSALRHDFPSHCVLTFFLAFFPTLLLAVGLASTWIGSPYRAPRCHPRLHRISSPGQARASWAIFLSRRGPDVWKFALLGWAGSLIGGSQVMKLLMEGIHLIYGDAERSGFLHRQLRGLLLLLITVCARSHRRNLGRLRPPAAPLGDRCHWHAQLCERAMVGVFSAGSDGAGHARALGSVLGCPAQGKRVCDACSPAPCWPRCSGGW